MSSIQEYVYPPLLADLLVPLSQVPLHLAVLLWRAMNLTLIAGSVLLLARMLRVPTLSFEFAVLFVSAFCFFPVVEAISAGQIAIAMFALLTISVVAYSDGQIILSASALALASVLKVTPVLLIPLFFIWKDRRWLISYLSVSFGLVAAMAAFNGTLSVGTFLHVVTSMGAGFPVALNKSIGAIVSWIYFGKLFDQDSAASVAVSASPRFLSFAAKTVSLLFYLSCLCLVWRSRSKMDRALRATVIAVLYLAILCISPVSWRHGYAAAFIVVTICWAGALRTKPRLVHAVLLCLLTVIVGTPFLDAAAKAPLPQFLKIVLSASWVIICILFSLETLSQAGANRHARETEPSAVGQE